jgi:hypothetical protein
MGEERFDDVEPDRGGFHVGRTPETARRTPVNAGQRREKTGGDGPPARRRYSASR